MALKKTQSYKGYTADYWRVTRVSCEYAHNQTQVIMALYKDKATRDADPDAVLLTQGKTFGGIIENRADAYAKVKEPVLVLAHPEALPGTPGAEETIDTNPFSKAEDL